MPLASIRDVVFSISNAPMCAAMARRQLVRRSSVGRRKTGVDTKLVGKLPEKTQPDLELGLGLVGGANREHGCSARCSCKLRALVASAAWELSAGV